MLIYGFDIDRRLVRIGGSRSIPQGFFSRRRPDYYEMKAQLGFGADFRGWE